MKIVDSNILLSAANRAALHHAICSQWLELALTSGEEIGFHWTTIIGLTEDIYATRHFRQAARRNRCNSTGAGLA